MRARQAASLIAGLAGAAALTVCDPAGLDPYTDIKLAAWCVLAAAAFAALAFDDPDVPPFARLDAGVLLALVAAAAATLFSVDRTLSLLGPPHVRVDGLIPLLAASGGYALGRILRLSEGPRPVLLGLAGAGFALGAGAVLEAFGFWPLPGLPAGLADGRAVSLAGSPVYLGAALAVSLPAALDLTRSERGAPRLFSAAALFLSVAGLWLCRSRGAWLAAVAGVAVWAACAPAALAAPAALSPRLRRAALACALGALCLLPVLSLRRAARAASDEGRVELWRSSMRLAVQRPLTGWGLGTLELGLAREADAPFARAYGRRHTQASAHNDLLHAAVVAGLPGAAALALLWVLCLLAARSAVASALPGAAAAAAGLAALFVQTKVSPVPFGVLAAGGLYAACLVLSARPGRRWSLLSPAAALACFALAVAGVRGVAADRAHRRAREAERAGRFPEAERAFKDAARLDPSSTVPAFSRTLLLIQAARAAAPDRRSAFLEAAVGSAQSLLDIRPAAASGWHALGLALAERGAPGDRPEAVRCLDEALARDWRREGLLEAREALAPATPATAAVRALLTASKQ